MNIGQAAEASGLPAKTIRYYEDIGLVPPAARRDSGFRDYGTRDVHVLRFVARARGLGFTVEECRQLLALWQDQDRAAGDVKRLTQERIALIDDKIAQLQALRATLDHLARSCHGGDRPDCPILDGLAQDETP
jgi:MerR family transcriptional regulator, copper efflux regulator